MGLKEFALGGKKGREMPGDYKSGDTAGDAFKYADKTRSSSDPYARMKLGLGGYTGKEEQAIFDRNRAKSDAAVNAASRGLSKNLSQSGVGGGLSGNFMANLYGKNAAELQNIGNKNAIANIALKDKRLGDYASMDKSIMNFGAGLAQQDESNRRFEFESLMRQYGMDPERQSGGMAGMYAESLLPGFGGKGYNELSSLF